MIYEAIVLGIVFGIGIVTFGSIFFTYKYRKMEMINNFVVVSSNSKSFFLKMDTRTGKIWLLNDSCNEQKVIRKNISIRNIPGRFTLNNTSNENVFLLVDQISGTIKYISCNQKEVLYAFFKN